MRPRYLFFLFIALSCGMMLWLHKPAPLPFPKERTEFLEGPAEFARFHKEIRTAAGASAPAYAPGYRLREYNKARAAALNRGPRVQGTVVSWTERGPSNVPGRTRGLIVDPDDATKNTWYAGSAGGGIWKTTDAGETWTLLSPALSNLATTTLAMAASQHDIIYAGTGEGFGNLDGINGNGMFKSTNRGVSWSYLPATSAFSDVNRLAVDPTNPDIVVAATGTGIYRTVNGGANWVQESDLEFIQDLKVNPVNFNIQYATQNGVGVLKSIDGGQTWALSNAGMFPSGRIEIAISPANGDRIIASAEGGLSGNGSDLYVSNDAGLSWSLVNVTWNNQPLDFLGGQGWYDNIAVFDPFRADVCYVGGVNIFKVTMATGITEVANYSLTENGTDGFLFLAAFSNIQYSFGRLTAGPQAMQRDVEIRFGPGVSQMAHRFTVPTGATSGVPAMSYAYANYVEVPFEAWDVTDPATPRQLMVSFRDQANNGQFDLVSQNFGADPALNSREYVYINDIDYSATPGASITTAGGQEFNLMYSFFPALAAGATWDPDNLPASTLLIEYTGVPKLDASLITISDAYNQFDGKNRFVNFGIDVHPDQHNLVIVEMSPLTYKMILCNDGGIFVSNASVTPGSTQGSWKMSGLNYRTSQFYGADKRPGFDQYFGGTQDNGTWFTPSNGSSSATTAFNFAFGGDGFEVIWHNLDDKKMIGGSQGNNFKRTENGGVTWVTATAGLGGSAPFISKLANSRDAPDRLYALSSTGVFRSLDFGGTWLLTSIADQWGSASSFMDVEVSRANADIVWAGSGMINDDPQRNIHVSQDGGVTFTATVNPPTSLVSGGITKLASHPFEEKTAYALFSQAGNPKILRTTDLGQTWEDISGFESGDVSTRGFPDVAVYCLYVRPDNPDILWAGTEIGIVESVDNGQSWSLITEFPGVSVWDMKAMDNQVVIATHGRGVWTATIDAPQIVNTPPAILEVGTSPKKQLMLRLNFPEAYSQAEFYSGTTKVATIANPPAGEWVAAVPGVNPGQQSVKVLGYRGTAPIHSRSVSAEKLDIKAISNTYATYFETTNGLSFQFFSQTNFTTDPARQKKALHSIHPYPLDANSTTTILYPVVVSPVNPFIYYSDIALVEPGLDGAAFGTPEFNDYVVMEASKNGLDWVALEDGYDARLYPEWLSAFNSGAEANRSLFRNHKVNLLNTFAEGDTLLFRYRLFSNTTTNGWGAAVDYITIQDVPTGLEQANAGSLDIFPNPAHKDFNVRYTLQQPARAMIEVIDLSSRVVLAQEVSHDSRGTFTEYISTTGVSPGAYLVRLTSGKTVTTRKLIISR